MTRSGDELDDALVERLRAKYSGMSLDSKRALETSQITVRFQAV